MNEGAPATPATPITPTSHTTDSAPASPTVPEARPREATRRSGFFARLAQRIEAGISRLSVRNNFWHRVCSWIWLPLAYHSGIRMKKQSANSFSVVLPFRRFNRNWYNAMAGAALLGNSEVAGGMYVFGRCGADYTVVCKHLNYRFLRPCFGPALYRVEPMEDIDAHLATAGEFNITLDMTVVQMVRKVGERERRVGKCTATFHVTPKAQVRHRRDRRRHRTADGEAGNEG
ncbi:MAG: hypothetical protein WD009_10850 [Phycisphaeraceae bacterium]